MSEQLIIRHCAPTLAGLKTASLFNCTYENGVMLKNEILNLNKILRPNGVRIVTLRLSEKRALINVYRP